MGVLEPARRSLPVPRPGRALSITLPSLEDLEIEGRRVLIRADLNVPLAAGGSGVSPDGVGRITDDFRIRAFLPTLEAILERGGRAVVCSHLGRPKGPDPKYTLAPVAAALSTALAGDVPLAVDPTRLPDVRVALLENLRFNEGETKNDPAFVDALVANADAYVNDAFGSCHRAHASIVGPPSRLPSATGLLLQREVENLSKLLDPSERPYVVIIGGSKVADKIGVVRHLLDRADEILLGGAMCFTFLKATGAEIGKSLFDEEHLPDVEALMKEPSASRIRLPRDVVVADNIEAGAGSVVPANEIPSDRIGVDIGPETANAYASSIAEAKTLFWNGPMGVFENPAFATGTRVVADAVAACEGFTATGGGDVSAALASFGLADAVDFASTGGGASLEFLEGKTLPGIEALQQKE